MAQAIRFDVEVLVQERYGRWAATTTPFAITMYGATEASARDRAMDAMDQLMLLHREDIESFLKKRGVFYQEVEVDSSRGRSMPHTWRRATRYTDKQELVLA